MANPTTIITTTTTTMTTKKTTTTKTTTTTEITTTTARKRRSIRITEVLPIEIQVQILLKLPIKSVLVCLKVCASWNRLIREPWFNKLHHSYVSPLHTIMYVHSSEKQQLTKFGVITEGVDYSTGSSHYNLNFTDKVIQYMPNLEIVGSCNGLLCLSTYDLEYYIQNYPILSVCDGRRVILHNPVLDSYLMLPDPPQLEICYKEHFGFGYIPSTGQYKVVKIGYMEKVRLLLFNVCTILSGKKKNRMHPLASAWRTIYYYDEVEEAVKLPILVNSYSEPAFFCGSIIWIAESGNEKVCHSLIYFDVETEEIQTLPLPPTIFRDFVMFSKHGFTDAVGIGVYYDDDNNKHLYLCEELQHCANIWVMKEYKCTDSLKLKWVIPFPHRQRVPVKLYKVHKDGKLLIAVQNSKVGHYDPNTGAFDIKEIFFLDSEDNFFRIKSFTFDSTNLLGFML